MPDEPDAQSFSEGPERPASWQDVARVALRHHLRGPWAVAAGLVALGGLVVALLGVSPFLRPGETGDAGLLVGVQATVLKMALPVLALMLVLPSYRGAWLRDPAAARERVGGFFAGTWAALVLLVGAWALAALLAAAFFGSFGSAFAAAARHFVGLSLLAGVWAAVALLVAVSFRREETRWVAAFFAWAVLTLLVPQAAAAAETAWRFTDGVPEPDRFFAAPSWGLFLDLLDPGALEGLVAGSDADRSGAGAGARQEAYGALGHPLVLVAALLLWIALPLLFAVRAQARGEEPPPVHLPF